VSLASAIYGSVARARRGWYAAHPEARRRLARPVVSVGNVSVGGRGKTPLVAHLARLLIDAGERPSILTRGYARRRADDGVTVVSDGCRLLADIDRAGDEPLMLARALGGVPVLVSSDRYLAGTIAERRFGCTVHVLDDGFQHFQLERDLDLVLVGLDDVARPVMVPSGHLREPIETVRAADACILTEGDEEQAARTAAALGVAQVFRLVRVFERARLVEPAGRLVAPAPGTRVLAVAGIARPQRFFEAVASAGWRSAGKWPSAITTAMGRRTSPTSRRRCGRRAPCSC
jgi:tetraacyldisaccharide 4'-kinase